MRELLSCSRHLFKSGGASEKMLARHDRQGRLSHHYKSSIPHSAQDDEEPPALIMDLT
jgi:hypothetical protein